MLLLLGAVAVAVEGWYAVKVWRLRDHRPETTAFMDSGLARLRAANASASLTHHWIDYERISVHLKRAVVASEDAKFTTHAGFDWDGIQHALERNLKEGTFMAGGSTISQQLAKNLYLSAERSLLRKGQEAVLTVMLETMLDKRRILEIYLNVIEWGEGVFGIEAAARYYFGVGAAALDPSQAAWLAAMMPRPRHWDRTGPSPTLERRARIILERMPAARIPD